MRKVFASNELSETVLVRDALLHAGVAADIRNDYSGHGAVPAFRPPAEVWIADDAEYEAARRIVTQTVATMDARPQGTPWRCASCREENPQSFELCWHCGRDRPARG